MNTSENNTEMPDDYMKYKIDIKSSYTNESIKVLLSKEQQQNISDLCDYEKMFPEFPYYDEDKLFINLNMKVPVEALEFAETANYKDDPDGRWKVLQGLIKHNLTENGFIGSLEGEGNASNIVKFSATMRSKDPSDPVMQKQIINYTYLTIYDLIVKSTDVVSISLCNDDETASSEYIGILKIPQEHDLNFDDIETFTIITSNFSVHNSAPIEVYTEGNTTIVKFNSDKLRIK